jgi:predicted metal-dependent RNase
MILIFFLVVTPTSLIMRILKKDLLNIKKNNSNSYWITKSKIQSKMKNQF